jgi:hypothetical protein
MVNHKGFFYVQVMDKKKAQVQTAKKSRLRKEVKKKDKAGCL